MSVCLVNYIIRKYYKKIIRQDVFWFGYCNVKYWANRTRKVMAILEVSWCCCIIRSTYNRIQDLKIMSRNKI